MDSADWICADPESKAQGTLGTRSLDSGTRVQRHAPAKVKAESLSMSASRPVSLMSLRTMDLAPS